MHEFKTKMMGGVVYVDVTIKVHNNRMYFFFPYNSYLINEIKTSMEKRKWHGGDEPPLKVWSAPLTQRNLFVLEALRGTFGSQPYKRWDEWRNVQIKIDTFGRKLYSHQQDLATHGLLTRWFIWAAEMGVGKSLSAITVLENFAASQRDLGRVFWIGPKSALRAADLEFEKWNARITPEFFTYEGLVKLVANWNDGESAPQCIIFDESSKAKSSTSKRALASKHVADAIRAEYKDNSIIGLLSGTPAPKSPVDWWMQCEIACPGFLREATVASFRERLGIFESRETVAGAGVYRHKVSWLDDSNKCALCGEYKDQPIHNGSPQQKCTSDGSANDYHDWKPSSNEVAKLSERMNGLVLVKLKRECLDLPEKIYEVIRVAPTQEIKNAAKLIVKSTPRAAEALIRLRELSDGFQYREEIQGDEVCPLCRGTKVAEEFYDIDNPDDYVDQSAAELGVRVIYDDDGEIIDTVQVTYGLRKSICSTCNGKGKVPKYVRSILEIPTPKDGLLREQLDLHEEVGRLNVFAGFTASIDRIVRIAHKEGWGTIRVDGRGWFGQTAEGQVLQGENLLKLFATGHDLYSRLVFVGQPGAAGMGITLTASPTTVFWSNDFNGENRLQAEDRGHRIGMDVERGGRIIDFVHLETDQLILNNLQAKKNLQLLSMTGIERCLS